MANKTAALLTASALAGLAACRRGQPGALPDLSDAPVVQAAALKDLPDLLPGYGIALAGGAGVEIEVNIEAEDAPKVREGEAASAFLLPDNRAIPCRVSRVLRGASRETGQAIAWLKPAPGAAIPVNEFVYVNITASVKHRALTVPKASVLIRDGKNFVVRAEADDGKVRYVPVEVTVGGGSDSDLEIKSGLGPKDRVVVQGAIGYLYPDFKGQAED